MSTRTSRPTGARAPRGGALRDAGAATLETTAVTALAALLVVGASVPFLAGSTALGQRLAYAICQVVTLGQGSCTPPAAAAQDREPPRPCVVSAQGGQTSAEVSAAVAVGGGEEWLIEQMSDGTWRMTRGTEVNAGVPVGVGWTAEVTVDSKDYSLSLQAGASAGGLVRGGETWVATSEEEARAVLGAARYDHVADTIAGGSGPLRWLSDKVTGREAPPESDEQWVELGVEADASADMDYGIVAGAQAGASAEVQGALGYVQRGDGTRTAYFEGRASAEAAAGIWTQRSGENLYAEAGLEGELGALVAVDYDADGNATSLRVTSTLMGDLYAERGERDQAHWTDRTMELPLTSTADREVAGRILGQAGIPYVPGVHLHPTTRNPVTMLDDAYAWRDAVLDRGYLSDDVYTVDERKDGGALGGELLVKVGLSGENVGTERQTVSSHYYDGMGMVPRHDCAR